MNSTDETESKEHGSEGDKKELPVWGLLQRLPAFFRAHVRGWHLALGIVLFIAILLLLGLSNVAEIAVVVVLVSMGTTFVFTGRQAEADRYAQLQAEQSLFFREAGIAVRTHLNGWHAVTVAALVIGILFLEGFPGLCISLALSSLLACGALYIAWLAHDQARAMNASFYIVTLPLFHWIYKFIVENWPQPPGPSLTP